MRPENQVIESAQHDAISDFIEMAKRVCLHDDEKAGIRTTILPQSENPVPGLLANAGAFRLSDDEKKDLKSDFLSFMKENPMKKEPPKAA